jgi:outer membrane protein assembly factor BamB
VAWSVGSWFAALAVAAAITVVAGPAPALAAVTDWPQFRETALHQAHNTNENTISDTNANGLRVSWTGTTGGAVNSSPAVANGVIYVGSSDGKLYAYQFRCATGGQSCSPLWTATTGGAIDSSPAAVGTVVYVGSSDGKLYAYSIGCGTGGASCTPLWTATTGGPIHSSPTVDSGVVYVGSDDGKLYAFAVGCATGGASCSPLWTATTGAAIASSPAVGGGVVYVGSNDSKLYAFAVGCATGGASCSPLWTATTGGAVHSSPTVLTGVVYVGSLDGKVYAYDAAGVVGCAAGSCTPLWYGQTGGAIYSSPATGDGRVWIGSDDGKVYSFHIGCNTGGAACLPQWTATIGHEIRSSAASANDVLYVGDAAGNIYALDADCVLGAACAPIWTHSVGTDVQSSPAVSDGVVYVGSSDHKVYAFDLGALMYVSVTPARILDSRFGTGLSGAFNSHHARTFQVTGNGGIPAGATAITGNVTVTEQTAAGFLYVGPNPVDNPTSSTLNFPVNDDRANGVDVALGPGGSLSITYAAGKLGPTAQVIFDVSGYFAPGAIGGATYHPLTPARILDSRVGSGLAGTFSSHVARTFQVTGQGGVPGNASAVTGNVTVTQQTSLGFVYIGPNAQSNPTSSTQNFPTKDDRANTVTLALGAGGTLSATYAAPTLGPTAHIIFDVTGYFTPDSTGATFVPVTPARILDTRFGTGLSGAFSSHVARTFQVTGQGGVPAEATAVTGNLTVTQQSQLGFLYIGPNAINNPTSSTLNFPLGDDRANGVTVALAAGTLSVTYAAPALGPTAHVIFDVSGYFTP